MTIYSIIVLFSKVSLVFFNKAGWEVMTYEFPPDSIDDNMGNVLVKLQQPPNAMARIDGYM